MQYHQTKTALGSETVLVLCGVSRQRADILFDELWRRVFKFERQFSRFLPGSELSVFNRGAGIKQFITPEFKDLLSAAKQQAQKTGGLYNPFILPALQAAGYDHSLVKGYERDAQDDHSNKTVVSAEQLQIGDDWALIPYGTAIDLGGCGKGYLAGRLADYIQDEAAGYWLSLGGDIVAGGQSPDQQPWKVAVQDAGAPDKDIGWVEIPLGRRLAVATSGVIARKGAKNNKPWHHLIDPRSLAPADSDVLLATVCGRSALEADVLASCAVILGSKTAPKFLEGQGIKDALLQYGAGATTRKVKFGDLIHAMDNGPPAKHNKKRNQK